METANHEYYVSLEVAKLLKQAGFDWDTYSAYNKDGVFAYKNRSITTWNDFADYCSAPTLSIAQKWLREVKGMDVYAYRDKCINTNYCYETQIGGAIDFSDSDYDTYESALEAGINKCLTLLLKEE